MYVFQCLCPAALRLKYKNKKLGPKNEFLLTLMKLRCCKDDLELTFFFGISKSSVGRVFHVWISFMFHHFQDYNMWISRDVVDLHMPEDFQKKFPKTRVIIDGTEIPITKPAKVKDQAASFSTYKNRNTLKALVGISPNGLVTYVSEAYGGSASDRQIVERSELLKNTMFEKGDQIMADRGFVVQDLMCSQQVQVNMPSFLKGLHQLPAETVIKDRRIASKRIEVERVIGLAKTFKILTKPLHSHYVPIGGRILYICFALTNFKPAIVAK
jgi:hypothetical protein